jgi:transcriptional regulator with XRE-family HTH domain
MNSVNARVKELRLERKLSQEEFGKAIGLSKSGVSNIENGTRAVRLNHIRLICSEFGVSESWLCEGLATEAVKFDSLISFLKSASYLVNIQQTSETNYEIDLKNNGQEATFTETEFEELQTVLKEVVEAKFYKKLRESKQ